MRLNEDLARLSGIERLKYIMSRLRSEQGCPWDREQTHLSLKKYLLEETYEVLQAIDEKNMYNLLEELGDLLLQVVFHAQIAEEEGEFTLEDVMDGLAEKMLRRHPHVFADSAVLRSDNASAIPDINQAWERIKRLEKQGKREGAGDSESEDDYLPAPKGLPALMEAEVTQRKASQWGFDWRDQSGPRAKVHEELAELERAVAQGTRADRCDEMGDTLFSLVNVSRFIDVDPEDSLRLSTKRFRQRFNAMMKIINLSGNKIENMSLEELDEVWDRVERIK